MYHRPLYQSLGRREFLKLAGASAVGLSLQACSPASSPGAGSRVIVGGAGLSGLTAALLLEERGFEVTVLEARDRLGGRVHTLDDVPGHPEGGGPTIGTTYKRLLRIAEFAGADLQPGAPFDPNLLLHVNGEAGAVTGWPGSPANQTVGAERNIPPPLLLGYYIAQDIPLKGFGDWVEPGKSALDIPLDELLRQRGASEEALRLINVAPNTNQISSTSALWALRNSQRRRDSRGGGIVHTVGGNSRIVEGMAAGIQGEILHGMPIEAVRSTDAGVTIRCADGSEHGADYVLLTLPFATLRKVKLDPPLRGGQKEAVERLPYTAITKFYLAPKGNFWDEDGLPPTMWTDSVIERVFPNRDEQQRIQSFTVWVDGANAQKLDALPRAEQEQLVISELARLRPSTEGKVEVVESISWGNDPWAGGAYAHWAPGQITRLQQDMIKPWQRIHFAGEHTAVRSPGLESALESAERAVDEILAAHV